MKKKKKMETTMEFCVTPERRTHLAAIVVYICIYIYIDR